MPVTEDALLQIIEETWNSTLGFQVDRQLGPSPLAAEALTVYAKISGEWSGGVQLDCPLPLARLIAAAIFKVEAESAAKDEILDALSELVHIVGGNLKTLLPQPVRLSFPAVSEDAPGLDTGFPPPEITRLVLTTCGHSFVVTLRGGPATAGPDRPPSVDIAPRWA